MLWLRFPPHIDVPRFVQQVGVQLGSWEDLKQEDTTASVLVHLVYSTDQDPRAVIHDHTDTVFVPVNVAGLSVSISYLVPRRLVTEMVAAISPVSQPGGVKRDKSVTSD